MLDQEKYFTSAKIMACPSKFKQPTALIQFLIQNFMDCYFHQEPALQGKENIYVVHNVLNHWKMINWVRILPSFLLPIILQWGDYHHHYQTYWQKLKVPFYHLSDHMHMCYHVVVEHIKPFQVPFLFSESQLIKILVHWIFIPVQH